jgi:exosortase C (VPDSG-CTERM-specific)
VTSPTFSACGRGRESAPTSTEPDPRRLLRVFALFAGALSLCFCKPLLDLARYAAGEDLYTHVFLVPFISLYLVWVRRGLPRPPARRSPGTALMFTGAGLATLGGYFWQVWRGAAPSLNDYLSWTILGYLCFLVGGMLWIFGRKRVASYWFPVAFLLFIVPMPDAATRGLESFLIRGSAEVAAVLFQIAGTVVLRTGLIFQLPGITLEVAPECSGIRSTYVLFMTCLLAGDLLLRHAASRATLALVVVPLGLARNALRIFVIAMLCVHLGPDWIYSSLHRRGGPLFFVASLVPLFLLLLLLRKIEDGRRKQPPTVLVEEQQPGQPP